MRHYLPISRRRTWFLGLLCFFLMPFSVLAANEAGMAMNVRGSLTAKAADGALRVVSPKTPVYAGDTLFVGKDSFAIIKFNDRGIMTLRSETQFKIENFHFNEQQPKEDKASFSLLKGGMRAVSGLVGHRGDPDAYQAKTPTGTLGIRGTVYSMFFCQNNCGDIKLPDGSSVPNGTHVEVEEGAVALFSGGASQTVKAGQFAYMKELGSAPVLMPPESAPRMPLPPEAKEIVRTLVKDIKAQEMKPTPQPGKSPDVKTAPGAAKDSNAAQAKTPAKEAPGLTVKDVTDGKGIPPNLCDAPN